MPLPPPLEMAEAIHAGHVVLGTCDWGGCDRPAWGVRWSRDHGEYLTVCEQCRKGPGAVRPWLRKP